jgi:hypothetical protein
VQPRAFAKGFVIGKLGKFSVGQRNWSWGCLCRASPFFVALPGLASETLSLKWSPVWNRIMDAATRLRFFDEGFLWARK